MTFPVISSAEKLKRDGNCRFFIGAYGFEDRSLGWVKFQKNQGVILNHAMVFRYQPSKGHNMVSELRRELRNIGETVPEDIKYDPRSHNVEALLSNKLQQIISKADEIIIDISAMTKLLILVCLCKLEKFSGTLRIVYSEPEDYAPTKEEYEDIEEKIKKIAKYPSRGVESIIRTKCLSSIRMQGQPVTLIAFTSFNEQLIRHMLGTISPHRLLFINGRPPRTDYDWRERATQEIHNKLIEEYKTDNPNDKNGKLKRVASTLEYKETVDLLDQIYEHEQLGTYERIICASTGSKMQTVGLFFSKIIHPDIHIEYPTPDSYFVKGMSKGVRKVHEIVIPQFSKFLIVIRQSEKLI